MCRPRSRPIVAISVAELAATGRPSMRMFQTLVVGKIGQTGAPGTVGPLGTPRFGRTRVIDPCGPGVGGPGPAPLTGSASSSARQRATASERRIVVMLRACRTGASNGSGPVVPGEPPLVRFRNAPTGDAGPAAARRPATHRQYAPPAPSPSLSPPPPPPPSPPPPPPRWPDPGGHAVDRFSRACRIGSGHGLVRRSCRRRGRRGQKG